jgi:hypothetical protein
MCEWGYCRDLGYYKRISFGKIEGQDLEMERRKDLLSFLTPTQIFIFLLAKREQKNGEVELSEELSDLCFKESL